MKKIAKFLIPSICSLTTLGCLPIVSCKDNASIKLSGGSTSLEGLVGYSGSDQNGSWVCSLQGDVVIARFELESVSQTSLEYIYILDGCVHWKASLTKGVYEFRVKATTASGAEVYSPTITLTIANPITLKGGCPWIDSYPNVGGYDRSVWKVYDGDEPTDTPIKIKLAGETKSFDNIYFDNGRLGWDKSLPLGTYTFELVANYKGEEIKQGITLSISNHTDPGDFIWSIITTDKRWGSIDEYLGNQTKIVLPQSTNAADGIYALKDVGVRAFKENNNITSVVIPSSFDVVEGECFAGCEKLETVVLGPNITGLSNYSFKNCKSLKSIKIPKSVVEIRFGCFDSSGLNTIDLTDWGQTKVANWDSSSFTNINETGKIILAKGAISAKAWKETFKRCGLNIDDTNWVIEYA